MAEVAYELERFAPQKKKAAAPPPKVQLAPKKQPNARRATLLRMARTLVCVLVLVALVSGVLYTQASLTELQTSIAKTEKQLAEEKALNAYLSFELDNMTSLKNIEERAAQMELGHTTGEQVSYFRTDDGENIQVRENPLVSLFDNIRAGFLSLVDFFR